jgi:serine/threonine protein kinase/tetratricopeptide (TPR) repeat protein
LKCPSCKAAVSDDSQFCSKCGASLKGEAQTRTIQGPSTLFKKDQLIAGKYRIIQKIGEGGMGVVYKAQDTKLDRPVALKFLPSEMTRDPASKKRFVQEAKAAAALSHPNITVVYDIGEDEGQTFIAMEFIEGKTLRERIESGPLEIEVAVGIASQVTEGLKEAHDKGIIHRDIKPANIMLTKKGQAKIMDFGLAKLPWGADLTQPSMIMGTVAYMSPEQIRGEAIDHRTDIWSLGTTLYEMLMGKLPFGDRKDHSLIHAILNEKPKPLMSGYPAIPRPIERLVLKMLEKDPKHRQKSVDEILKNMRDVESAAAAVPEPQKSIAVLPFVNMSADPENEYFSDGLAEELINGLTKIRDLRVVARTSSFAFKGEKTDIREVGAKLNVKTLLEGSVRKAGSRLRITAQLINVADGYHLWSERFDSEMEDIFAIQDEITDRIVAKLKAELLPAEGSVRTRRPPTIESYDQYLRGRYYANRLLIDKAIVHYERAIALDPDCAPAYASLAEAYVLLSTGFDLLPSREAMPKAREAAQKALEIDPRLAEVYVSLGLVATCYDWDRESARKHFQKAIELNPNSAAAHQWIEFLWTYLEGDTDKASAALERAQALDPMNIMIKVRIGYMYLFKRDYDSGVNFFRDLLQHEPDLPLAYHGLMESYGLKGMYEECLASGAKMMELLGRSNTASAHLGVFGVYSAWAGNRSRASQLLAELESRSANGYPSHFWMAAIHYGLGDRDKTFELLNNCLEERDGNLIYITTPPPFDSLRDDPRYEELLKRMNLENLLESKPWLRK